MLADTLNKVREQTIAEIEQRANTIEGPGVPSVGRTQRLNAIFEDLIAALLYGGVNEQAPLAEPTVDLAKLLRPAVLRPLWRHPPSTATAVRMTTATVRGVIFGTEDSGQKPIALLQIIRAVERQLPKSYAFQRRPVRATPGYALRIHPVRIGGPDPHT
jgi:hypothetical protein